MINPNIKYWPNGNKFYEEYRVNGKLHRDPLIGPAEIIYYQNGQIERKTYYLNGQWHRNPLGGPAHIVYHENGNKWSEQYYLNDEYHRDPLEGPAYILYHENEHKKVEKYFVNDNYHNPYGPAFIYYKFDIYEWWLNGIEYTNEVNEYLDKHDLKWQNMTRIDFDIMWTIIL